MIQPQPKHRPAAPRPPDPYRELARILARAALRQYGPRFRLPGQ